VQVAGGRARHRLHHGGQAVRDTPLTTLKLAQIFTEAGLPSGVFNIVLGLSASTGKALAEHRDINKLVLTGGTEAGRIAGSATAKVFAHQTMELGGKTPVMVFEISTSSGQ
jgi:acyl-CoA reductase-like NAD-dependent aldehyde dehydrogenase